VARPRRLPALRRARCRPGYGQQLFERAQVVIDRPFASPSITGSANLSRPLASATRVNVTLVLGPDGSKPHVVVTRVPEVAFQANRRLGSYSVTSLVALRRRNFAGGGESCPDTHRSSGRLVRLSLARDVLRTVRGVRTDT